MTQESRVMEIPEHFKSLLEADYPIPDPAIGLCGNLAPRPRSEAEAREAAQRYG